MIRVQLVRILTTMTTSLPVYKTQAAGNSPDDSTLSLLNGF